jgi:hypothetical protein
MSISVDSIPKRLYKVSPTAPTTTTTTITTTNNNNNNNNRKHLKLSGREEP